jgi:hypothetical protein
LGGEKEKEDFAEFGEYCPQVSAIRNLRLEINFLQIFIGSQKRKCVMKYCCHNYFYLQIQSQISVTANTFCSLFKLSITSVCVHGWGMGEMRMHSYEFAQVDTMPSNYDSPDRQTFTAYAPRQRRDYVFK